MQFPLQSKMLACFFHRQQFALKNLEPDIQNMMSNHKIQIYHLNERHQDELKLVESRLRKNYDTESRTLRENLIIAEEMVKNLERKISKQR